MNRTFCMVLLTASGLLTAVPATIAQEQPSGQAAGIAGARLLFQRGQVAYGQGDYETAIQLWEEAYAIDDRPLLQYNLSQAYERLGRPGEAAAALDRYVEAADPADPNQATARARRSALRERLGHTGIRLVGGPADSEISIDGESWGQLPRPDAAIVGVGTHQIRIERSGFATFRSSVTIIAGQILDVEVHMAARDGGIEASHDEGAGVAPWIVGGAGLALVGTAAALGVIALAAANDAPAADSPEADSAQTMAVTADILGAVGIAALGAAVVWLVLGSEGEQDDEPSVQLTPVIGAQVIGVDTRWSF